MSGVSIGLLQVLCLSLVGTALAAPTDTAAPADVAQPVLEYRLRAGESLTDVARVFRVSAEDIARLNDIRDASRVRVGQRLKVPDASAIQAAELRRERDQLRADQRSLAQRLAAQAQALATRDAALQRLEREKSALASAVAMAAAWRRGALALAAVLLALLAWNLKIKRERWSMARRIDALARQNAALQAAKEKYRQAAAQLELRHQKLRHPRDEAPQEIVSEGTKVLARAFAEGSERIEKGLADIEAERQRIERAIGGEGRHVLQSFRHLLAHAGIEALHGRSTATKPAARG